MAARRKKRSHSKGHVPLGVLSRRLAHILALVKRRGGKVPSACKQRRVKHAKKR
jgi:hypothetical protein